MGTRQNLLAKAVLTSTHTLCFEKKYEKYQNFLSEKFPFLVVKFSIYLNRHVFVMIIKAKGEYLDQLVQHLRSMPRGLCVSPADARMLKYSLRLNKPCEFAHVWLTQLRQALPLSAITQRTALNLALWVEFSADDN